MVSAAHAGTKLWLTVTQRAHSSLRRSFPTGDRPMRWVVPLLLSRSSRQFRTAGELACPSQPCAMYSSSLCVHCRVSSLNRQLAELLQHSQVQKATICAQRKTLDFFRVSSSYFPLVMCRTVCRLENICFMRHAVSVSCIKRLIVQTYLAGSRCEGWATQQEWLCGKSP